MRPLLAAIAALLFAAPVAQAGTISAIAGAVSFTALPGERNDVSVDIGPEGNVAVRDIVPMEVVHGCRPTGHHSAECPGPLIVFHADLGDGDDSFTAGGEVNAAIALLAGAGTDVVLTGDGDDVIDAGAGDDRVLSLAGDDRVLGRSGHDALTGGEGADTLDGGAGHDALAGDADAGHRVSSAGADTLTGGEGDDLLDGDLGGDSLSGGDGFDTVSYAGRNAALTIRIDDGADDGELSENDTVRPDVEVVLGGSGPDLIVAGDGVQGLYGHGGDDLLVGGGGADSLAGGDGADRLLGDGRKPGEPGAPAEDEDDAELQADDGDALSGGAGRDALDGGGGVDGYFAGDGDDVIDALEPGEAGSVGEIVGCGTGQDAARLDIADSSIDCEAVVQASLGGPIPDLPVAQAAAPPPRGPGSQPPLGRPTAGRGLVLLPVRCPARNAPCTVSARVVLNPRRPKARGGRRPLTGGRATATIQSGHEQVVAIRLGPAAIRRLNATRSVRALAEIVLRPRGAKPSRWARPFVLSRAAVK